MAATALTPAATVTLTDGTEYRVETSMADLLAWERYALANGLEPTGAVMSMLIFYMWRAARKTGVCPNDVGLDAFAERIADFDVDDEEPANPTRPGHGED